MDCMPPSSAVDQKYWRQPCPCLVGVVSVVKIVTQKVQPEVARYHGVSGVLGVIKRRLGTNFDDSGRCGSWAVRSRNRRVKI